MNFTPTSAPKLSVILPAYNEEGNIVKAYNTIAEILNEAKISFEVLFVDDGSKDDTWSNIKYLANGYPNARGIRFSRNYGKEAAMHAGMTFAKGECVVIMDTDLQHPPQIIPAMYHKWERGFKIVHGVKRTRGQESAAHSFFTKIFYSMMSTATKVDMSKASDFKLMDKEVVKAVLANSNHDMFMRALAEQVGFKSTTQEYDVREREAGESKWSTMSLIKYAINNITASTTFPLMLPFIGAIIAAFTMVVYICLLNANMAIISMFAAMLLTSFGIVGMYLAKVLNEVRNRPKYIVADEVNG